MGALLKDLADIEKLDKAEQVQKKQQSDQDQQQPTQQPTQQQAGDPNAKI